MTPTLPIYLVEILSLLQQAGLARLVADTRGARLQTPAGSVQLSELALPAKWPGLLPEWAEAIQQTYPDIHIAWHAPNLLASKALLQTEDVWQHWQAKPGWAPAMLQHLKHSLAAGHNILWTGWWPACVQLITALVDQAGAVGAWHCGPSCIPPHFAPCKTFSQCQQLAIERIVSWSGNVRSLVPLLQQQQSVCAWLPASRVDRLMCRFELACAQYWQRPAQPLDVLAAIDWIVVMAPHTNELEAVYQVVLIDSGYQLRCVTEQSQSQSQSLTPEHELQMPGPSAWAEQTTKSAPSRTSASGKKKSKQGTSHLHPTTVLSLSRSHPVRTKGLASDKEASAWSDGSRLNSSPREIDPGWELERHLSMAVGGASGAVLSAQQQEEAANLAATFGLGPPPMPGESTILQSEPEPAIEPGARHLDEGEDKS